MIYLALILTAGALARLILNVHRENARLRAARKRSAALLRRVRRDRDSREESFQAAVEVCKEEVAKNAALLEELDCYRSESVVRARLELN
jgi:hypothetical protein